jgi:hypothetical protein
VSDEADLGGVGFYLSNYERQNSTSQQDFFIILYAFFLPIFGFTRLWTIAHIHAGEPSFFVFVLWV